MQIRHLLAVGLLPAVLAAMSGAVFLHRWDAGPAVRTVTVGLDASAVAVDVRTGHVFVSNSSDGTISLLDARSGAALRTISVGGVPTQIAVDERTGRAFILNDATSAVSVIDTTTGAVRRTVQLGGVRDLAVDERTGHVFVVGLLANGRPGVSMLDARSGALLRAVPTPLDSWGIAVDARAGRVFVTNRGDGSVSVLDAASGRIVRTVSVGPAPSALAVDALTDRVFVAANGGSTATGGAVSILDARLGRLVRTVTLSQDPAAVVADEHAGRVFVVHGLVGSTVLTLGHGPGGVDVLDARTGRLLGSVPAGALPDDEVGSALFPRMAVVDERRDRVYVVNRLTVDGTGYPAPGSVSMLDARSGRVLRTITVGREPVAMAIDEATARLFVVNKDGENALSGGQNTWGWLPVGLRRWIPWLPHPSPPTFDGSVTVLNLSRL